MDQDLLERVLSDAQVVDLDLSGWDKAISIYVLADHLEHRSTNRKALAALDFSPKRHYQWIIHDFQMTRVAAWWHLRLSGLRSSPLVEVTFEDVVIREVSLGVFDEAFPGWDRPHAGLARPSPERLHDSRPRPKR